MTDLFVIPTVIGSPYLGECLDRIEQWHPDADYAIASTPHYAQGAYADVWRRTDADFYYLIHDSLFLNAPLPVDRDTVTTLRWFAGGWGWDEDGTPLEHYGAAQLAKLKLTIPPHFRGVFGPIWCCPRRTMDELDALGYWNLLPETKWQQSAMERVTGIVLEHLGYDVTNSIQGQHVQHFGPFDETYATKVYGNRP